jgi:hypothetical protein
MFREKGGTHPLSKLIKLYYMSLYSSWNFSGSLSLNTYPRIGAKLPNG